MLGSYVDKTYVLIKLIVIKIAFLKGEREIPKSIYIGICKYDLDKPFSIVNKSENNNNNKQI